MALGYGPSNRRLLQVVAPFGRVESAPRDDTAEEAEEVREMAGRKEVEIEMMEMGDGETTPEREVEEDQEGEEGSPRSSWTVSVSSTTQSAPIDQPGSFFNIESTPSTPSSPSGTARSPSPPLAARPLSLILSHFTHRASLRLSSLELLDSSPSAPVTAEHSREPTQAQLEEVERELEESEELQEVRSVIEREEERMEGWEEIEGEEDEEGTWFERVEMVRRCVSRVGRS